MWIFTKYGFFSVSCSQRDSEMFEIRARNRNHLLNLINRFQLPTEPSESPKRDYGFRIVISKSLWLEILICMANEQRWSNFKKECQDSLLTDSQYIVALHKIWATMFEYQDSATNNRT